MNKKIIMNRISLILCFFAFFFLLGDRVEAKPTTCTYEYDLNTETDGNYSKIQFSVNENDELVLSTGTSRDCTDSDFNGTVEDDECFESSVRNLTLSQNDVEEILDKTGKNTWISGPLFKGDRNSEKFLSTMKNAFGWEKERVHDVLDNGCTGTNCNVSIKLTSEGYCPKIYVAQNITGTLLTTMPSSIDCNGSKVFSWISGVTKPLSICHGKDTGGYDAIENRQCSIDENEINSIINKAVNDSKITSDINEKIVNLQRLINKESFDPSDYTDKNKIESYCNGPLNAIEDLIKNIDSYNLNANEIENIRASVKNNYSNCKFSLSDEQVNEKIINSFDKKIQELKQKAINLNDDAKEKAQKCVEAANAIDDSDKDDILDNLNQKNDQINDLIDNSFEKFKNKISSIALGDPYDGLDCEGLLGDKLLSTIDKIFGYVKIAAPIILIVLGSVDFGQAVLLDDKDALKKAGSKFIKRAIVCIAIFFVPTILSYILHYVDGTGVDPMCGIK